MGYLSNAIGRKSGSTLDLLRDIYSGSITKSGKSVNARTAMQVATVFACCRVIGEGIAQVPLKLMKISPDGKSRMPAKDHPLYEVLASRPNAWQTSFEYREMLAWHVVLAGAHFSFINRGGKGQILELIPFAPGSVTVKRADDFSLSYEVRSDNGKVQRFPEEAIWHVRGPSWNSWQGLEAVALAREAIGLAMATEESTARLHKNGVRPAGVYSVDSTLNKDQYAALRKWIDTEMAGAENAGTPMVLDRGAKWLNTQMSGVDAQSLENRRFQIEEICRFARVMPIMVGYSDKAATYASSEQMFLAHVVHTLAPWYQRLEQSIDANLLSDKDRTAGLYANFVEEGLLRGSAADTKDMILGYVNGGVMTTNEGRAKLDLNPDPDPESDQLRIPANIVGDVPEPDTTPEPDPNAKRIDDLALEIRALAARQQPINVDARTTVNTPSVDARTTVTLPEMKAADVHVDVASPVVNLPSTEVNLNIEADGKTTSTVYTRDPETKEITSSTTRKIEA